MPKEPQPQTPVAHPAAPDALAPGLHPVLQKLVDNIKPIAIGLAALLVITGGYGIYASMQARQTVRAANELGQILTRGGDKEKLAALEAFAAQAPASVQVMALFELVKALQEQKDFARAAETWKTLQTKLDPELAVLAVLGRAQALAQAGEPAQGLALIDEFKTKAPKAYQSACTEVLAGLAEMTNDLPRAIAAYQTLLAQEQEQGQGREYYAFKIAQLTRRLEAKS